MRQGSSSSLPEPELFSFLHFSHQTLSNDCCRLGLGNELAEPLVEMKPLQAGGYETQPA